MNHATLVPPLSGQPPSAFRPWTRPGPARALPALPAVRAPSTQWHADVEFMSLLKACRASGGLARIGELGHRMAGSIEQPRAFIEAALAAGALCSLRRH